MNNNTPLSPCPLGSATGGVRRRVLSLAELREYGVPAAAVTARCRQGGPWQRLLPGVFLLHQGPPTSEERLHGVLLYAARPGAGSGDGGWDGGLLPEQAVSSVSVSGSGPALAPYGAAMITGPAALTLHGFSSVPALPSLPTIDVLVPRTRRLRSTGCARVIRAQALPRAEQITGLPVAPVARALADTVAGLRDTDAVRDLLIEAVRDGHCEPAAVVHELIQAKLLEAPHVVGAVDSLLMEGRSLAEGWLYAMVRTYGLPEPVWNVDLRLPGGPHLGGVDAYWPEQAVAIELDTRSPAASGDRKDGGTADAEGPLWSAYVRKREHLERLGITVVHLTPRKLRESPEQQALVVRTALKAAEDREPAAYVLVLPV
ncbi:hypothetical protein QR77_11525 [Streptomyces sp. 150FB]|uniref:hypothetical protein n=1 Tax=Streptomyces sp. 150FB TaxID=1576605 RepID=UPI0005896BFA|nr:hypothetical protein [Streptomyces sp. 150FB]KIF74443.1 hypothetical protein QR77_11525 [Streptomyces sp. 150FB]